jgi:putative RecB family exonuclease
MLFYGLITWREKGVIPAELRLIFLGNRTVLTKNPTESDLLSTEATINEIARDIKHAVATGDFKPRKSGLCQFCSHQSICTVFGGTILPLPYTPTER